jgi:hypothetical protein
MSNVKISSELLDNYFDLLINKLFKVIPMKENNSNTLNEYLRSLRIEILGYISLSELFNNDAKFLSIVNTIEYLSNNEINEKICKREIFKCISIIEKIKKSLEKE